MPSPLIFELMAQPEMRLDVSALTPDNLLGKSVQQMQKLSLPWGKAQVEVGQLFCISGDDADHLIFPNSSPQFFRFAQGMSRGRMEVRGTQTQVAGEDLACGLRGGEVVVQGDVGDGCARSLAGGKVLIYGNAGNWLGAPLPGAVVGMTGGLVWVKGNVGVRAADRMRRGIVLINGNCGEYLASSMIAGTVAVAGSCGKYPGCQMKRGTLLLAQKPKILSTFIDQGSLTLPILTLLWRSWKGLPGFSGAAPTKVRRFLGDGIGQGEILVHV